MASAYKHGVYITELPTQVIAPITGTAGLQVVVGTAPVNMAADPAAATNTPILANTYKEAVEAVGYSDDFAKYTLCEAISACFNVVGVGPIILINVLDPNNTKHVKEIKLGEESGTDVTGGTLSIGSGILPASVVIKKAEGEPDTPLVNGEDYMLSFDDDGTLIATFTAEKGITKVKVEAKQLDPSAITADDIVGGVDNNTGKETGLEVVRQVYPKLNMTPGLITAPRWSKDAKVAAAMQAKTKEVSGVFTCNCIVDIDSGKEKAVTYTKVKEQKEAQALTNPNAYAVWLYGKVGDAVYSGSTLAAALTAYTDAANSDTPNVSPSNKAISISAACLEDGTEVILDQDQANTVNSFGVATWLNVNGFRLWGNNTVAYPATTDPKDRWFSCRRFLNWAGNTFILTYFQKVDSPLNKPLIEAIVDSERIRGNSFVARGVCARYEIAYLEEENPTTELLNGHVTFHQYCSPFPPAEQIEDRIEFDANALSTALA